MSCARHQQHPTSCMLLQTHDYHNVEGVWRSGQHSDADCGLCLGTLPFKSHLSRSLPASGMPSLVLSFFFTFIFPDYLRSRLSLL
jgi:hypothetical protein